MIRKQISAMISGLSVATIAMLVGLAAGGIIIAVLVGQRCSNEGGCL